MKNILITHFYTRENGGDAGILHGAVQELDRIFPASVLTVHTMEDIPDGTPVSPVIFMKSYFYWAIYSPYLNAVSRTLRTVFIIPYTMIVALTVRLFGDRALWLLPGKLRRVMYDYAHADIVLPIGGGYLTAKNTIHGTITTVLQLHAMVLALIFRKPVILLAQSIGPYATRLQTILVRIVLNRVRAIFVREKYSLQFLASTGIKKPHIDLATDSAFLCSFVVPALKNENVKPVVAITARRWFELEAQERYEGLLASFADWLISEKACSVCLVPQVTATNQNDNDATVLSRILHKSKYESSGFIQLLPEPRNLQELWGWYHGFYAVVGTRMHSVIFALTNKVPCIAIGYEYKTTGIMQALTLGEYVTPIDSLSLEKLKGLYAKLETEREQYTKTLELNMAKYKEAAKVPFGYLKEHYGTSIE